MAGIVAVDEFQLWKPCNSAHSSRALVAVRIETSVPNQGERSVSEDSSKSTETSQGAADVLRDVQLELQAVQAQSERTESRLRELREHLADDSHAALERAMNEDPSIERTARAIRTEALDALHQELPEIVLEAPEVVPDDQLVGQLDDTAARLMDQHEQLVRAVDRLSESLGGESFSSEEVEEAVDTGITRTSRITAAADRLQQLLEEIAPGLSEKADDKYVVTGTVKQGEEPLAGATVRAFDRDLAGEELLGETTTNENGWYRITFSEVDSREAERSSADLLMRVYNEVDEQVAKSDIHYNVGPRSTIDLSISAEEATAPSEYERLRSELKVLLSGQSVRDLSDEQLEFLTRELDLPNREEYPPREETLYLLQTAMDLAARTPFEVQTLYALVREDGDLDRSQLTESEPSELAERVTEAVEEHIVHIATDGLEERLARNIEHLRRATELEAREEVQTTVGIVTADDDPLVGATVRIRDPDDERKQRTFKTNENGRITFSYMRPPESGDSSRRFRLIVINQAGITIHEETVSVDEESATEVMVTESSSGFSGAATLESIRSERGLSIPELDTDPEITLGAIRRAGGVENFDVSTTLDADERESVNALATLDLLTDPETGSALAEQGYTNQQSISETSFTKFQSTMEDTLDPKQAATIHIRSQAQTYLLDSMAVDRLTARRNGTLLPGEGGSDDVE